MTQTEIYTLMTAGAAAVAAFFSSAAAIYQCYSNKIHQDAAVAPVIIDYLNMDIAQGQILLSITNKGLGPALIEKYEYQWNGETTNYSDLASLLKSKLGSGFVITLAELAKGSALGVNEKLAVIKITPEKNKVIEESEKQLLANAVSEAVNNFKLIIDYKPLLSERVLHYKTEPLVSLLDRYK